MEDVEVIHEEDLDYDLPPFDVAGDLPQGEEEFSVQGEGFQEEEDVIGGEESRQPVFSSYRVKIIEILKNLHSPEIKIYSEASKEFISLLRGETGGGILREYIQLAPKCSEIVEAWRLHQGKPGMAHILSLVSVILDHPDGKSQVDGIGRNLDNFSRLILDTKLIDIYTELNSQESRRQSAALKLLASIVRRGGRFASEVAKSFDFKMPVLSKLSGIQKKKGREERHVLRRSTRKAFVGFAMSFLEVGNPRLLRWVLQQRELYSGVLRGLGRDDIETIIYVLSTLQNKILVEDCLVPPALRSVLFGSTTLEQLSYISANPMAGHGADIAHEVLLTVCTDPSNGLMPGSRLKGNEKRLFELMKKLKATEVGRHRELLLAIINKRPSLSAAYMDEFPYHLEPRSSSSWFTAISLVADVISSVNSEAAVMSFAYGPEHLPAVDSDKLQSTLKNIIPRACNRSLVNKGLLHADILVKHGSLRFILESLKSLGRLIMTIDSAIKSNLSSETADSSSKEIAKLHGLPGISCFGRVDKFIGDGGSCHTDNVGTEKWVSLRQHIQDEVRGVLPDPQVLLKLLSSLSYKHSAKHSKRTAVMPEVAGKRLKSDITMAHVDIIISGMDTELTNVPPSYQNEARDAANITELDGDKDRRAIVAEIWGLNKQNMGATEPLDEQDFFYSRLLDVLALYMRILPSAFEGSFDFFKILPSNALSLPTAQQQSLLSLLVEHIGQSPGRSASARVPDFVYKHLQPLINLLMYSPCKRVRDQAYVLAKASFISTGAFDQNLSEIDAWLISLPGYSRTVCCVESQGAEALHSLHAVVISFLCDAVSTVGNNLYKHLGHMHKLIFNLENFQDDSPGFSPLIICILQKSLRLLESDSGTFKLYERSSISLYVSNALNLILQSQIDMKILPGLIDLILSEKFVDDSKSSLCEWRPLKNLLHFAQNILNHQTFTLFPMMESTSEGYNSFQLIHSKIKEFVGGANAGKRDELAFAFLSSVICASFEDVLRNLTLILTIAPLHFSSYVQFLSYVLFLEPKFLAEVVNLWPDMFLSCLEKIKDTVRNDCRGNSDHSLGRNDCVNSIGITLFSDDLVSKELAATAFSLFLRHASFYALFSSFVCFGSYGSHSTQMLDILHSPNIVDLLKYKVAEGSTDDLILFLRCVLFWAHQILSSYKAEPSDALKELFQMCFTLVDCIFEHVLADCAGPTQSVTEERPLSTKYVQDVIELILHHPLVALFISYPICCSGNLVNDKLHDSTESLLTYSKQNFHKMDYLVLQLLTKVFENFFDWASGKCQIHVFEESVLKASRHLVQKTAFLFREKFDDCVDRRDFSALLPYFYIFHSMMRFFSPFDLLELAHWMFCKVETGISGCSSALFSAVPFCLSIADDALDLLYGYLKQSNCTSEPYQFYGMKDESFNADILQKVYDSILDLVIRFDMEIANICLLKVVNFVYNQRSLKPHPSSLPLYMLFSCMVIHSPRKLLLRCLSPTSKIKATTLSLLMEVSPLHMSFFGQIFLGILNNDSTVLDVLNIDGASPLSNKVADENCNYCLSGDDFVLLLPAVLSYVSSHGKDLKVVGSILIFYSKILLENLSNWKSYVSKSIFEEQYPEHPVTSSEDFHNCLNSSLVGKAVIMLHYFFILNGSSVTKKQRLKIFDSIHLRSFEVLDHDLKELNACSYQESLKLVIEVYSKITFTRLLLSPVESLAQLLEPETGETNEMTQKKESKRLNCAKLRFITILVNSFDQIVRICPLKSGSSSKSCTSDSYNICRFLEHYILKNIIELSIESKGYLDQLPSIPYLDHFIRSCLLHRFEDPATLKAIRCFVAALSERTCFSSEILGLLLGHSQFVSTILSSGPFSDSSALTANESLLQSLPSVLRSLDVSYTDHKGHEFKGTTSTGLEERRLELIKLLRVLYHRKSREYNVGPGNLDGKDSRELLVLLLSTYGATLSETDLQILHLMHEIESSEGYQKIAEMDYLWGKSVLKIKEAAALDQQSCSTMTSDCESSEDLRKMLFRENIPVDTKQCLMTILHFCYDRSSLTASISLENLLQDKFVDMIEQSSKGDLVPGYDPAFILRFSLHSLVMGFIDPREFSQLGLLAIAFVSISSLDEELRRLGYEVLGRFKLALENCRRNKDLLQLQLLLTYFQNGITEPWEKVPSVFAIFAAEASFILLEPRQNHFFTISKLIMHSPNMNLKSVPLFHTFFGSTSIHFKMERMWILQLLYAGINLSDDAKIYRSNKLLEFLLSFCASSMKDSQSSFLILQVMKKSVQLPVLADYLVKECGLLSWLFSVLSFFGERLSGDQKQFSLRVIELVLKIVNDVVSTRSVSEWLQECAVEQISELSSHLHALFVNDLKLLKENVSIVNLILHVMISTIRLSHKRTTYQPHFTISLEGLFQLYLAINAEFSNMEYAVANKLGVMTILMSTPMPVISKLDKARLVKLVRWAISASLQSLSQKRYLFKESYPHLLLAHKEQQENESLISKLLRWVTASVILGSISNKSFSIKTEFSLRRSSFGTLQSLLEFITKEEDNFEEENFSANEALAVMIVYLQQLLRSSIDLPSVIFALCSLLISDGSSTNGEDYLGENHIQIALLCSKIRCPVEANPAWRWSFDQPWRDVMSEKNEIRQMEEEQACRSLLIIFSTALGGKQSGLPILSYLDLEHFGLLESDRVIIPRK